MATDYQEAIRILSEQEKILQFDSFTSEDAWKLGNIMVEDFGLNYEEYKLCGGGFPIRVHGCMTHVITVSALAHEKDHAFIVGCLEKFLGKKAPAMDMEIPML